MRRRSDGSCEEGREQLCVLLGLDDVVDAQTVDVGTGAGVEGGRGHLAGHLRHRVRVLGYDGVLLVDGDVEGLALTLAEADAVRRLRGGEDDLADPETGGRLEDVVVREDIGRVRRAVGGGQDARDGGEVDDRVVGRSAGQVEVRIVEVGHGRYAGHRRVGLPGVGQVDAQIGDVGMTQRREVRVGDLMALRGEVGSDVMAGLATASGEEDAHAA